MTDLKAREAQILEEIQDVKEIMRERDERIGRWETDYDDCAFSIRMNQLEIQKLETELDIVRNGGKSEFSALFDIETGDVVSDKLIDGKYGLCFLVKEEHRNKFGTFVGMAKRESTYTKKGLRSGKVLLPARVITRSNGSGMLGAYMSCVCVIPA